MLRVVVAVALAVALFAVAQPAIEEGQQVAAERAADRELAEIERAVEDLQSEEAAVPFGQPGARYVVTLDLPERSLSSAGVEYVAIGGLPNGSTAGIERDLLAYRVGDSQSEVVRLGIDVRVGRSAGDVTWLDDGPLVLRGSGRHRLAFTLVEYEGERVVVVREV